MTTENETANQDTSDAFARASAPMQADDPHDKATNSKKAKKAARSPVTVEVNEKTGAAKIVDDPGMSPEDAAAEIVGVINTLKDGLAKMRGYERIMLPSELGGGSAWDAMKDPEADKRLERAFVRLMKTSNAQISPGAAVAFGLIASVGLPVVSMEAALFQAKKGEKGTK